MIKFSYIIHGIRPTVLVNAPFMIIKNKIFNNKINEKRERENNKSNNLKRKERIKHKFFHITSYLQF